ncbi:hypothetical protein [Desulfoluna butyratoxydans]|uniref:hypothetical protein n=1 Tax=Desulfoluna butyratoxydans TaxID=231438 RepID=UPI001C550F8B|nr:hypothetical protein [Desulfoluna butyratoxydans]
MKKAFINLTMTFIIMFSVSNAYADLDNFLSNLNIQAKADIDNFSARLSAQFSVPYPEVQTIIRTVEFPADVFMCLQLGKMTNTEPESVVEIYRSNKNKGWGAIAKELGIEPGSADFHALKRGSFSLADGQGRGTSKGQKKGKNKAKGKGHNKKQKS